MPPDGWPGKPPVNRAQGCFAALLWLTPTVFVVLSCAITFSVAAARGTQNLAFIGGFLILINVLFTIGTGWFTASLSRAVAIALPEKRRARLITRIVVFFVAQLAIIPLTLFAVVYAICAANPFHL